MALDTYTMIYDLNMASPFRKNSIVGPMAMMGIEPFKTF
jgi:hypothetical protein